MCFLYIGLEAVDCMKRRTCVERDHIRTVPNNGTILLVKRIEVQMSSASIGMVYRIPACYSANEWTWVLGEGMQCQTIKYNSEDL
jgi:hypothetical protein